MVDVYQPEISKNEAIVFSKDYFNVTETDYLFKGQIEIYGNQISTLLVIKKINDTKYRMAITNDFGTKLLDIEVENERHKIVYVAKDLNKKIILNPLISDLLFLEKKSYFCRKIDDKESQFKAMITKNNFITIDTALPSIHNYVFYTSKNKRIKEFSIEVSDNILNAMTIQHHELKLKINYSRILNTN